MRTLSFHTADAAGSDTTRCCILLPGAYQDLTEFVAAGFDRLFTAHAEHCELLLVAPEPRHLTDRDWLIALRDEIVRPARKRCPGGVWLGGISLGGFMALRFAADHTADIDGLCLLAPYLGSRLIATEIAAGKGLGTWQCAEPAADDDERRIWRLVQRLDTRQLAVFLGLGADDRFADTQQLLADALPADALCCIEGGHEWAVWRQLWENFLLRHGRDPHDGAQRAATGGSVA